MQHSTVQVIHDNGFRIGPPPDEIHFCSHRWGDHVLAAPGSPLDGGTFSCPYCDCKGTWNVTGPSEEDKAFYRRRYLP